MRRRALTESAILLAITNGIEGSMPSIKANLPVAEVQWNLVFYVTF